MKKWILLSVVWILACVLPASAMHLSEGILPAQWAGLWFAFSIPFVAWGLRDLRKRSNRVTEALHSVGAEHLHDRAIHHLSFGGQKRVAIAGTLAMKPSILILDEPTAGLDPGGEHEMIRLLGDLNHQPDITVVLAAHSVDLLPLFADRIYLRNRGRVLKQGPAHEVSCDQELMRRSSLRLPYVSRLLGDLNRFAGSLMNALPLTIGEARLQLLELIPQELIVPPLQEAKA